MLFLANKDEAVGDIRPQIFNDYLNHWNSMNGDQWLWILIARLSKPTSCSGHRNNNIQQSKPLSFMRYLFSLLL